MQQNEDLLKELIGKQIYKYFVDDQKLTMRVYRITDAYYEEDAEISVKIPGISIPLKKIGSTTFFSSQWFSFERNDAQAQAILFGHAKMAFASYMQEMLETMDQAKKDYEALFEIIEKSEITEE